MPSRTEDFSPAQQQAAIFRKSCHEINGSCIYTLTYVYVCIFHRPTTTSSMNNESSKAAKARKEKVTSALTSKSKKIHERRNRK